MRRSSGPSCSTASHLASGNGDDRGDNRADGGEPVSVRVGRYGPYLEQGERRRDLGLRTLASALAQCPA